MHHKTRGVPENRPSDVVALELLETSKAAKQSCEVGEASESHIVELEHDDGAAT